MIDSQSDAINQLLEYYTTDKDLVEAIEADEPHDYISEIADSNVDVYNSDLLEWVKNNYSYVEDSIEEFGAATDNEGNPDFMRQIQQGQYHANEQELWEAWNQIKEYASEWEEYEHEEKKTYKNSLIEYIKQQA